MLEKHPFLLEDIDMLRNQILSLEQQDSKKSDLWRMLKSSSRSDPLSFGWFVPFVALMTREKQDIDHARKIIFTYIDKLDPMSFCSGLQFHFWCFAFPHAKVSIYFQWLCTIGAFSEEEKAFISEHLILYHFVNFYYGMRTKPEPECIDNQTLSLTLSSTIVGYLFSNGEQTSKMAELMLRDGLRRLPAVIGDMPLSGYSGEGSSYMDCVNGPAIPLAVEVLERITGKKGLLFEQFEPSGAKPIQVLEMVAREFMPGGLLLPWDNYGYQFGVRSALAYGAIKSGKKLFARVLEEECNFTYDIGIGWAYDDLVWTLIWWPQDTATDEDEGINWFEPSIGGTLVSGDSMHYLMQMWDESTPVIPTRAHMNPNSVLFNGYGVPISADGSPVPNVPHSFQFEDTWRSVGFISINTETRYNYGDGCCGAHSCIIIDGNEGMKTHTAYRQYKESGNRDQEMLYCDVTPVYQENFPDITKVFRKSSLHCDRFFLIEDLILAEQEHTISSRFLLRPHSSISGNGIKTVTPEGVTLYLEDILGNTEISIRDIENHPHKPDGCSQAVDFTGKGKSARRLFLAMISNTIDPGEELTGFQVVGDKNSDYGYAEARRVLENSSITVPMKLPAYMEEDFPNYPTWWYQKLVEKQPGQCWLKLPAGIWNPKLYLNDEEIDLEPFRISRELLAPRVELPRHLWNETKLNIIFRVDVPIGHYDGGGDGTVGMTGGMWLCYPQQEETVSHIAYENGNLTVTTDRGRYITQYFLTNKQQEGEVW